MKPAIVALLALSLFGLCFPQYVTSGGNVTNLDINGTSLSVHWDGVYGEVVLGAQLNYPYDVIGGHISRIDMIGKEPSCTYSTISMHVIAVNSTSLNPPLSPGNFSILDSLVNGSEKGSSSFTENGTFDLTYGHFVNVPTLFTMAGNATSPYFREGYLNDARGNLVFVADISDNKPDWNGSTSDFQIILPRGNTTVHYTLWVDVRYTCIAPPPGGNKEHRLYIDPIGEVDALPGQTLDQLFSVTDNGDFPESDINVSLSCPDAFSCGSGIISYLGIGVQKNITLPIIVDGPGEYVLIVCAKNLDATYCRDFIVKVGPECSDDSACPPGRYCQNESCQPKKKQGEICSRGAQCESGLCKDGSCVLCAGDADCGPAQYCSGGSCMQVPCSCGAVSNHSCVSYACCLDADCGSCSLCSNHQCEKQATDIFIISGELLEGGYIRVQVVNQRGEGIGGAQVSTSEMSSVADGSGFSTIKVPYDGIIYASADCHPKTGIMFNITRTAHFIIPNPIYVNESIRIQLVDSHGIPIPGAQVTIGSERFVTDGQGYVIFIPRMPGQVKSKGLKAGYKIDDGDINVLQGALLCRYPLYFSFLSFSFSTIYVLWIIALVMAFLNLLMMDRRFKPLKMWRKLAYSFGPLVLALPGIGVFSICFVANVVLLQLIVEIVVLLYKLFKPKEERPRGTRAKEESKG